MIRILAIYGCTGMYVRAQPEWVFNWKILHLRNSHEVIHIHTSENVNDVISRFSWLFVQRDIFSM